MAVTATLVSGTRIRVSNKREAAFDLVFSGNYATGGETVTAASLGFKKIEQCIVHGGVASSTDLATSNPIAIKYSGTPAGTSIVITQHEGSAAGTALSEKTNAEAYATGSNCRVTVVGF